MTDILVVPDRGYPWVLSMQRGVVVRKSPRDPTVRVGRIRKALNVHCGHMPDNPAELAEMRRVILLEEAINGH